MKNEKMAVALNSMFASGLMTIGKFAVGVSTGSLGIISEALHSFLDFLATVMTYMAVRVSDNPADAKHPYGHAKIESVTALAETLLLFLTSFWIIYEAVSRLWIGKAEVEATWLAVAVILISIAIDISRARALSRVAKKTKSQALEADALHFSSDVWSSTVVLLGLGFVAMGYPKGDTIAAIGVSIFICHAGWDLGRRTIDTLIDTAPLGLTERITEIIDKVEGISGISRVRVRPTGSGFFIDADVSVGRSFSQEHVASIRENIIESIRAEMPEAEVTIMTHPLAMNDETIHQRIMMIAFNHNANVHHITLHHSEEKLSVSLDLEVEASCSIYDAHEIASGIEASIHAEFGDLTEVETHIEPLRERGINGIDVTQLELEKIKALIDGLILDIGKLNGIHKLRACKTEKGLIITFHCRTAPERSVSEVHEIIDELELKLREAYQNIWRIVVHAEPEAV